MSALACPPLRLTPQDLGLPSGVRACLLDLDGVLTDTARVHATAWKAAFDQFLREWSAVSGRAVEPFDDVEDYGRYVDGRPRLDGVRAFLAAREIEVSPKTVQALARAKNDLFLRQLRIVRVRPYEGSLRYLRFARVAGLRLAVVSASANCSDVLRAAGLDRLVDVRVDGRTASRAGLRGKPAADTFLAAAEALCVSPRAAAVFEDSIAGVAAGRSGDFGWVVGVDRVGHGRDLVEAGADVVVADLAELLRQR